MSTNKNISIRLTDYENELIRSFAELNNTSISEFIREKVLEYVQKEEITAFFEQAYKIQKGVKEAKDFDDAFSFVLKD